MKDKVRQLSHLGIVAPVYCEEDGIGEFIDAVVAAVAPLGVESWELILVDDGSKDRTLEIMQSRQKATSEITVVEFSRNFGHQAAVTAGLRHAVGKDAVVVMDADMQDPPRIIPDLVASWERGNEVIFARRTSREEKGLRRLGFDTFHKVFRFFIEYPIPRSIGVFGLLDRAALEQVNQLTERNRFLPGLHSWVGFRQDFVDYARKDRSKGEPKQKFSNLFKYAFDGILSFSYKPMRLLLMVGAFSALTGFLLGLFYVGKRVFGFEDAFTGFTTLVILVIFFGGMTLLGLGLVGEYVARIYDEVKNRPIFIVKQVHKGRR